MAFNNHGEIRNDFIAFIALLVINGTMLLVMKSVPFEIELILRRLLYLTLVFPVFGLWLFFSERKEYAQLLKKNKSKSHSIKTMRNQKLRLVVSGLLSCILLGFALMYITTAIIDVFTPENFLLATIVDIDYNYRSPDVITLSNGENYDLYPNGYEVKPGETYKFRIMEKSDLAVPWKELAD